VLTVVAIAYSQRGGFSETGKINPAEMGAIHCCPDDHNEKQKLFVWHFSSCLPKGINARAFVKKLLREERATIEVGI
jgi:hypothetical protein